MWQGTRIATMRKKKHIHARRENKEESCKNGLNQIYLDQ